MDDGIFSDRSLLANRTCGHEMNCPGQVTATSPCDRCCSERAHAPAPSFSAPSQASVPLLQKNARSNPEIFVSRFASSA